VRVADPSRNGQTTTVQGLQDVFDYNTRVDRLSGFGRTRFQVADNLTLHAGAQVAYVKKRVSENPISFFQFVENIQHTQIYFDRDSDIILRTSADQVNESGQLKYSGDDYRRRYGLVSPWAGLTLTLPQQFDVYANYALSVREPTVADWYDPDRGPLTDDVGNGQLKVERVQNVEVGFRYNSDVHAFAIGYYRSAYSDKVETVVDYLDRNQTLNAGKAVLQGIELSAQAQWQALEFSSAATLAKNRWKAINVKEIFGASADAVVGKVVPFAPEQLVTAKVTYRRSDYTVGVSMNWWDHYFATFTNDYRDANGVRTKSELPYFLDIGLHLGYGRKIGQTAVSVRLDCNNLLNREDNYQRAQFTVDSTRNDALSGLPHWYVLQAPLRNAFVTAQVEF